MWRCCQLATIILLSALPADGFVAVLRQQRRPLASVADHGEVFGASYCNLDSLQRRKSRCTVQSNKKRALHANGSPEDDGNAPEAESQQGTGSIANTTNNNASSNVPADPSPAQIMRMMGTSPRRIFLSLASSTSIALAANFFGVTSNLLSALPEDAVEHSGLDTYYPRGDYKRVVVRGQNGLGISSSSGKCSFQIPKEWVADTSLALAQAQRQAKALDYSMGGGGQQSQQQSNVLPDAAYGPPGRLDARGLSNGDTNVSVIVNTGMRNFSLKSSLGEDPTTAAEVLLSKRPRPTKLVSAFEERRGDGGVPVYQFEYTVDRGEKAKPLRAISVVAGSADGDAFVTLTVVSLDEDWEKPEANKRLRRVAESFKLV